MALKLHRALIITIYRKEEGKEREGWTGLVGDANGKEKQRVLMVAGDFNVRV